MCIPYPKSGQPERAGQEVPPKRVKITYEQLARAGACQKQLIRFERYFGHEAEVCYATALKYATEFDWTWATITLLRTPYRERYNAAANAVYYAQLLPTDQSKVCAVAFAQAYITQERTP